MLGMYRIAAETPLSVLPRLARGVQDRFHHCSERGPKRKELADQEYFEHTSGCRRLGVLEAARRLVSRGVRPFFMGDSVMNQLWLTVWKARQFALKGSDQSGLERWPDMSIMTSLCGLVGADIEFAVDRALRGASRPGAAQWGVACSEGDVLLLSLGLHYNLHSSSCAPSDYGDLREQILSQSPSLAHSELRPPMEPLNVTALECPWLVTQGRDAHVNCTARQPGRWEPGNVDKCREIFSNVCGKLGTRQCDKTGGNCEIVGKGHCDYVRDLRRLAIWLEANHARLPPIFFLDTAPQKISFSQNHRPSPEIVRLSKEDSGQWRNVIARAVFARHAPKAVTYVRFAEMLVGPQGWRGHLDTAHWCIDSLAWEEATSAVLTAVYAHAQSRAPSARCTRSDRIPREGKAPLEQWLRASQREGAELFGAPGPGPGPGPSHRRKPPVYNSISRQATASGLQSGV